MRQQAAEDYHNQLLREKQELESRLNQFDDELNLPENKLSFHNMDKVDLEARLQDVKQCAIPDFGVKDTSLIESIVGGKNFGAPKNA